MNSSLPLLFLLSPPSTVPTHRFPSLSSLMALTDWGKERFLEDSYIATHTFADNWESIIDSSYLGPYPDILIVGQQAVDEITVQRLVRHFIVLADISKSIDIPIVYIESVQSRNDDISFASQFNSGYIA